MITLRKLVRSLPVALGVAIAGAVASAAPASSVDWASFKSADATVNGVVIHYRMAGTGVPIVLMHGWMGTSGTFRKLAPLLAAKHMVVVPDMRGNGDSQKPNKGYDARTMANDIRALLKLLGITRAFIAGHDMSAPIAYVYAGDHPDEVLGMIYLDEPVLHVNLEALSRFSNEYLPGGGWWWGFNHEPDLPELLLTGREREFVLRRFSINAFPSSLYQETIDEVVRSMKMPNGITGSIGWYRDGFKTIAQMRDAKITVPVLAIGGQFALADTFDAMKSVVPHAEGGILPKSGHYPQEETPEALAQELEEFMQRHAK